MEKCAICVGVVSCLPCLILYGCYTCFCDCLPSCGCCDKEEPKHDSGLSIVRKPVTNQIAPSEGTYMKQDDGHIMISYQSASRDTMIAIRDELNAAKYKVWMDIDDMSGSTIDAMAEAVENAKIVLICMTKKYQTSDNCKFEAEYAVQKKKQRLFLKLERGFVPEGWLGLICGSQLFYEFTDKYPFDEKMAQLLKDIEKLERKRTETTDVLLTTEEERK